MVRQYVRVVEPTDRRECRLYRFWVRDLRRGSSEPVLGYVGETARLPFVRLMEHIYEQPWAGDIVAWEVDERVFAGKAEVLEAERYAIETERPLYNVEHNGRNPRRVDTSSMRGQPRPVPYRRRSRQVWPRGRGRRWPRWRVRAAAYGCLWLAVAAPLGVWSVAASGLAVSDGAWLGACAGTLAVGGLVRARRPRRRRRRGW